MGTTATGRYYYQGVSNTVYLYYDPDCDGLGSSGRWILDSSQPSVTRYSDLDGDGSCTYAADISSTSTTPPTGTSTWEMWCESCYDSNYGATDYYGDDCDDYWDEYLLGWSSGWGNWCGEYDDADFDSNSMCCACGGGDALWDDQSLTLTSVDSRRRLGADDDEHSYSDESDGMCLCVSDESTPSQKTSSPSMNSYLIVAATCAVVVIAAGSLCVKKGKPPSKGFSAPMVKQGTIEIPASQVTALSPAQGTAAALV